MKTETRLHTIQGRSAPEDVVDRSGGEESAGADRARDEAVVPEHRGETGHKSWWPAESLDHEGVEPSRVAHRLRHLGVADREQQQHRGRGDERRRHPAAVTDRDADPRDHDHSGQGCYRGEHEGDDAGNTEHVPGRVRATVPGALLIRRAHRASPEREGSRGAGEYRARKAPGACP
ncbi:hypothetical protein GCM10027174_14480 [Salinifilum aidingensis]